MDCKRPWGVTHGCAGGCWEAIFRHLASRAAEPILPRPEFCQEAAYIAFTLDSRLAATAENTKGKGMNPGDKPETASPLPAVEVSSAVGIQVMEALNAAARAPIAKMGRSLPDGTYEFLLGPVYLPHHDVSLSAPSDTRQLFANLRMENTDRAQSRHVRWLCRRGDDEAEMAQPTQAIVIDEIAAPPGEDFVIIRYHLSAR